MFELSRDDAGGQVPPLWYRLTHENAKVKWRHADIWFYILIGEHVPASLTIQSWFDERDKVLVEVEASGIGLEPTSIEQIFESMFTTKPHGMGMGLSISRSNVAAHGGRGDDYAAIFRMVLPTDASRAHAPL